MRYFVTLLIGIGLVILVIILLIRAIFGGGGDPAQESQGKPLVDYANSNVIMRTTIAGPIEANSEYEEIRIDVSQYSTDIRIINGFQGRVVRSESATSNTQAYASFLRALDLMGYANGDDREELKDERGHCPFGRRFIFEIIDGSEKVQRYWTTSCNRDGSFKGDSDGVIRLFRAQIPREKYNEATEGVRIR
jgi:hypothetical protein